MMLKPTEAMPSWNDRVEKVLDKGKARFGQAAGGDPEEEQRQGHGLDEA
jgi:hypothetical protein